MSRNSDSWHKRFIWPVARKRDAPGSVSEKIYDARLCYRTLVSHDPEARRVVDSVLIVHDRPHTITVDEGIGISNAIFGSSAEDAAGGRGGQCSREGVGSWWLGVAGCEAIAGWVLEPDRRGLGRRTRSGICGPEGQLPGRPEGQLPGGGRGFASVAVGLIEVEVRDGLTFGRVVAGRLVDVGAGVGVEAEVVLRRTAWGRDGRRGRWQAEVAEDGVGGLGCGDEGADAHVGTAVGAAQGGNLVGTVFILHLLQRM